MAMEVKTAAVAPGPEGVPVLGLLPELRRKGLLHFMIDSWKQYGDVVRVEMGPVTQHLIVRPEHVHQVLVADADNYWKGQGMRRVKHTLGEGLFVSEGELWREQRRTMQPPFTARGVQHFIDLMAGSIDELMASWEDNAASGEPLDINVEMTHLAMSIISRTLFSVDLGEEAHEAADAFTAVLEFLSERSAGLLELPMWVPLPAHVRYNAAREVVIRFIDDVVAQRRADGPGSGDLLDAWLFPEEGEPMDPDQLRDELLTIFFAGHETTAQALTWAWFLLAQHPEIEAQLQAMSDEVLGGRTPTEDDLGGLAYASHVFDETMRLYPPVWVFVRDAYEDTEIGGYHIPAGSMITLSPYITHHHPDLWDEPERFNPDRFRPENSKGRHKYAFFPFGGGPRVCLGNHFAMLEGKLALSMIAGRYKLRLVPGQHIEPKMVGTLRPSAPVMMTVEKRA